MENSVNDPPLRLLATFYESFPGSAPHYILKVPGRDMWIAARFTADTAYTLVVPDLAGRATFNWRSAKAMRTVLNRPLPRWARCPAGVIAVMGDDDVDVPGMEVVLVGDETAGLRYEYTLGLALAALAHEVNHLHYDSDQLQEVVDRARRDYLDGG